MHTSQAKNHLPKKKQKKKKKSTREGRKIPGSIKI
jgi:hypothetical protein